MPLVLALGKGRGKQISESEDSLVYKMSFRTTRLQSDCRESAVSLDPGKGVGVSLWT